MLNPKTMDNKRAGARALGIVFQFLAFVSIIGTLIAAEIVAHLGVPYGFNSNNDPVVWAIIAGGIFAACVLAGFGYVLGMLCAIYDRQNPSVTIEPLAARTVRPSTFPNPPARTEVPSSGPSIKETATWEFLTRERHVKRKNDE